MVLSSSCKVKDTKVTIQCAVKHLMCLSDKVCALFWLFHRAVVEDNEKRTDVLASKYIS